MSDFDRLEKLILQMHTEMTTRFDQIDAQFGQVDARFGQVDARFEQVDARFEQVDARFEQVNARFEQVNARFGEIDARFDRERRETGMGFEAVRQDIRLVFFNDTATTEKVDGMDVRLTALDEKVEFIAADTRVIRADVAALGSRMDAVELRLPPVP